MAQVQVQRPNNIPTAANNASCPETAMNSRPRSRIELDITNPVNQNGCFEIDRVLKSGHVLRRTRKTKSWKPIFLVLRPNRLSIYKSDKEDKLRHQVYLSDLTAVAFLKDPKQKRHNVFGLFSPSRNFHFEAPTAHDAERWVSLIRSEARIEEEEEEMFLASPAARRNTPAGLTIGGQPGEHDAVLSSSPEPLGSSMPQFPPRRKSSHMESSGWSGNELASHSDFSDNDLAHRYAGTSMESFAASPIHQEARPFPPPSAAAGQDPSDVEFRPGAINRSLSHLSAHALEQDPDRVIWQGWLYFLRTKGGVRQWKHLWGVLRPRNLILYKNESEYTAQRIIRLSAIVNVVDIDPMSRSKANCLQIITEEKSYRFATHDEESLVQCIGAFKSLLAKRRELETRAAAQGPQRTGQAPQRRDTEPS